MQSSRGKLTHSLKPQSYHVQNTPELSHDFKIPSFLCGFACVHTCVCIYKHVSCEIRIYHLDMSICSYMLVNIKIYFSEWLCVCISLLAWVHATCMCLCTLPCVCTDCVCVCIWAKAYVLSLIPLCVCVSLCMHQWEYKNAMNSCVCIWAKSSTHWSCAADW